MKNSFRRFPLPFLLSILVLFCASTQRSLCADFSLWSHTKKYGSAVIGLTVAGCAIKFVLDAFLNSYYDLTPQAASAYLDGALVLLVPDAHSGSLELAEELFVRDARNIHNLLKSKVLSTQGVSSIKKDGKRYAVHKINARICVLIAEYVQQQAYSHTYVITADKQLATTVACAIAQDVTLVAQNALKTMDDIKMSQVLFPFLGNNLKDIVIKKVNNYRLQSPITVHISFDVPLLDYLNGDKQKQPASFCLPKTEDTRINVTVASKTATPSIDNKE